MQQIIVIDKQIVQALVQYLTRQPLGEVLGLYQALQQTLARAETAAAKPVENVPPSPEPPNPPE